MPQQKIRIRLKAYDHQMLDKSAVQIVDTAQRSGATVPVVPLPTEKNVYTVIRSPFKDKDSRSTSSPHAQAPDRHPRHPEDGRLAHAARPARGRGHRDQALMKGIVGRKLGMTQVFDQETGQLKPVTVSGRAMSRRLGADLDADGYDAVQLALGRGAGEEDPRSRSSGT